MCLKSLTHIFIFLLGLDNVYFCLLMVARWSTCLSRHHVVCPSFSFMWRVQCSGLLRRVQRPNSWWRVQYFVADHAVRDFRLLSLDFVTNRRNSIVATTAWIDAIKHYCRAFLFVTAIVSSNWGSVSTLLLQELISYTFMPSTGYKRMMISLSLDLTKTPVLSF